jgi:hypothetical protein
METLDPITDEYRSLLRAAASSSQCPDHASSSPSSSPSRMVAQHLLSFLPEGTGSKKDGIPDNNCQIVYVCEACGAVLQPGYQGTTLRVRRCASLPAARRRTMRRNLQRKRKRQALTQAQAAKKQQNVSPKASPEIMKKQQQLVVLREDPSVPWALERHHLVLSCGTCNHRIRLQGLKRMKPRPVVKKNPIAVSKAKSASKKQALSSKTTDHADTALGSDDLGFVPLPKIMNEKHSTTPATSLLQQGGKKKKKKKPKQQGSKLMSFLSSLNDT